MNRLSPFIRKALVPAANLEAKTGVNGLHVIPEKRRQASHAILRAQGVPKGSGTNNIMGGVSCNVQDALFT
jgi:hypothetical protein